MPRSRGVFFALSVLLVSPFAGAGEQATIAWTMSPPLFRLAKENADDPAILLDPCVVRHERKWHLFAGGPGGVVYYQLDDFKAAGPVIRARKTSAAGLGVPQVYFHRPSQKWHLVGQQSFKDDEGKIRFAPVLSVNDKVDDPSGWSKPIKMDVALPRDEAGKVANWMDFYVIFNGDKAHLFGTSGGRLWRTETNAADFPQGWSKPALALKGNIIFANHTYRQDTPKGPRFFTTITSSASDPATKKNKQFQVSYVADRLDGPWTPEFTKADAPYAGFGNTQIADPRWNREVIHGEPLREGSDERMILEAEPTRFIFHARAKLQTTDDAKTIDCLGVLERARKSRGEK